jgi:hypothetical protein
MITFANIPKNSSSVVAFGMKEIGPYYWVGSCKNGVDYYAGQTFQTPSHGKLKRIRLFSSVVYGPSDATLSVFDFDANTYQWKQKRSETTKHVTKALESQWIDFELPEFEVKKGAYYAFKVSCAGGGMLAIAECPWNIPNPYAEGVEWIGSSFAAEGNFHKDFDLAFEGEIEALTNAQFI